MTADTPKEILAYPIVQPVLAWQYTGQSYSQWPLWVRESCSFIEGNLVHSRSTGRQFLYPSEYLVLDVNGEQDFYTEKEYHQTFERRAG